MHKKAGQHRSGHHHKPKPPKWKPPTGVAFNNPYGTFDERFALEHRILDAIRHTPKKGFIRIAIYSFDRVPMAQALMAAHSRGVHVQVLLNDHEVTGAERILFRGLGQDRHKKSFAYECVESCRGHAHNLHTKFYLFSKSGGASRVIMLGSDNLTLNAVKWQWNDLYTRYGAKNQYHSFVQLFDSMRHDYSKNQPYYRFCGHTKPKKKCNEAKDFMVTRVYPKHTHADNDDIMEALNAVKCVYSTKAGVQHTRVWIVMHTWRGTRGNYLAAKVRSLWAAGCDVKVDYGLIGFHTKQIIGAKTARGRIPLRSLGFDYNDDGVVDRYTHQKNFTILGDWHGNKNAAVGVHRLVELQHARHRPGRDRGQPPEPQARPHLQRPLHAPVEQQPVLPQRLHHDVLRLRPAEHRGRGRGRHPADDPGAGQARAQPARPPATREDLGVGLSGPRGPAAHPPLLPFGADS